MAGFSVSFGSGFNATPTFPGMSPEVKAKATQKSGWDKFLDVLGVGVNTGLQVYNTNAQKDLLMAQIRGNQYPTIVADQLGRPSGEIAPAFAAAGGTGVPGAGISGGIVVMLAVVLLFVLLLRR